MSANGIKLGFRRRTVLIGMLATLVGLLVNLGRADIPLDPSIPEQQAKVLRAASFYTEGTHFATDMLLKKSAGFEHDTHAGINRQKWRSFPSIYMLETMYLSAEAELPGSGERALALLAKDLAQRYKGVEDDPALKDLITAGRADNGPPIKFKKIERQPGFFPDLTPRQKAAIDALSQYYEGGGGSFGPRSILIDRMGLEPTEAYEILRRPLSEAEILYEGFKRVKVSERDFVLFGLVRDVDANFLNAQKEKDFDPYRKRPGPPESPKWSGGPDSPRPWRPSDGPSPGGGGGGVGGGPNPTGKRPGGPAVEPIKSEQIREQWQNNRAANHKLFQEAVYNKPVNIPTTVRPKFKTIIRGGRGFGGVVLGNDVRDKIFRKVTSIKWEVNQKSKEKGALVVSFDDGTTAKLETVSLEDAYAAHAIYFRKLGIGNNAVGPAESKDAIGLVGISNTGPFFDCGPTSIVNRGRYWSVVMHPAIADLELGWATLQCDVLPFAQLRGPVLQAVRHKIGEDDATKLEKMWTNRNMYTWKFTDVPIVVSLSNGSIVMAREEDPKGPKFGDSLRGSALITMNAYQIKANNLERDNDVDPEYADKFYPLVPALCTVSPEYKRLNEFARVCAFVRWVKDNGGEFPMGSEPPAPPPIPLAAGLVVTDKGDLIPAPAVDKKTLEIGIRQKVLLRLALLEIKRPALEVVSKQLINKPFPSFGLLLDTTADAVLSVPESDPGLIEATEILRGVIKKNKPSEIYERLDTFKRQYAMRLWRADSMKAEFDEKYLPQIDHSKDELELCKSAVLGACPEFEYWLSLRQELLRFPLSTDSR